jgi:putative hydrolase of HD superfamily
MNTDLGRLLEFVRLTSDIRNVLRRVLLETYERQENDAEHMYQMALIALYIIDANKLKLDKFRVMALAMVHDVAEAYAGDTTAFASDKERQAHEKREKQAIKDMRKLWPEFPTLHELIDEYEAHVTEESKFAYALDKLVPVLNNYLHGGKVWIKEGRTIEDLKRIKAGKVELSSTINDYYNQLLKILDKEPKLFGNSGVT